MTTQDYNDCVNLYSDDLYRFAIRYTADGDLSHDAVQDAFVTLWERHRDLEKKGIKGFLIRILYRRLVDMHRHEVVCRNKNNDMAPALESYDYHYDFEMRDTIQNALNQLPAIQRQLILLKDLEGYEYGEMAEITGISPQQVGVYLFRARKRMREMLKNYEF